MSFQNLFIPHPKTPAVERWLSEEVREQQARYEKIVAAMEAMEPQREQWYAEFLARIQTRGFNVDGDLRRKISAAEIPQRPNRPHKVVY